MYRRQGQAKPRGVWTILRRNEAFLCGRRKKQTPRNPDSGLVLRLSAHTPPYPPNQPSLSLALPAIDNINDVIRRLGRDARIDLKSPRRSGGRAAALCRKEQRSLTHRPPARPLRIGIK